MTGESGHDAPIVSATATVDVTVDAPETIAGALIPDNTAEMTTRVVDHRVITRIERKTIGGLRTSVDDVLVNLAVATKTAQLSEWDSDTNTNE